MRLMRMVMRIVSNLTLVGVILLDINCISVTHLPVGKGGGERNSYMCLRYMCACRYGPNTKNQEIARNLPVLTSTLLDSSWTIVNSLEIRSPNSEPVFDFQPWGLCLLQCSATEETLFWPFKCQMRSSRVFKTRMAGVNKTVLQARHRTCMCADAWFGVWS